MCRTDLIVSNICDSFIVPLQSVYSDKNFMIKNLYRLE